MGFKTITIKEDVYELIKKAKGKDESFSELFERRFQDQNTKEKIDEVMKYFGAWEMTEKEYEDKMRNIKKFREEAEKNFKERLKRSGVKE